jgi:hypothetical protein
MLTGLVRVTLLILGALALGISWCHVLEMPAKMRYEPPLYAAVNSSMYGAFAVAGAVSMVGNIVLSLVLAGLLRRRWPFRWTALAAGAFVLALGAWFWLVLPVNQEAARAWEAAYSQEVSGVPFAAFQDPPPAVIEMWRQRRSDWEFGHLTVFVIQLIAFIALVASIQAEIAGRGEAEGIGSAER